MSRKKQETKVLCPGCGTEFAIADKEFAATGTVIGKNSDCLLYTSRPIRLSNAEIYRQIREHMEKVNLHPAIVKKASFEMCIRDSDTDMRTTLKRNAFKWAPRNQAWQRQLTRNAEYAAGQVLKITI